MSAAVISLFLWDTKIESENQDTLSTSHKEIKIKCSFPPVNINDYSNGHIIFYFHVLNIYLNF
jgi:hypothetical protein